LPFVSLARGTACRKSEPQSCAAFPALCDDGDFNCEV
jgi:hypothetical protein